MSKGIQVCTMQEQPDPQMKEDWKEICTSQKKEHIVEKDKSDNVKIKAITTQKIILWLTISCSWDTKSKER